MKNYIAIIALTGLFLFSGCVRFGMKNATISEKYDHSEMYKTGGSTIGNAVSEIEIDWTAGHVTVEAYDGIELTFDEASATDLTDDLKLHYWLQDDGKLKIKFAKSGTKYKNLEKELTVKVPNSWTLAKVELEVVSAGVEMNGISCGEVGFEGVSSDLSLNGCTARKVEAELVSGNTSLDFRSDVAAAEQPQSISIESVSGNATICLPEGWGFKAEMESVSGKFDCPFASKVDKGEYLYGNGATEIEVETVSGSLSIRQ